MPSRAKMKMKRTRRTSRATMEAIESTRDLTKPPMAFQYLARIASVSAEFQGFLITSTYFVTLKALKRRMHLITERPTGGTTWEEKRKIFGDFSFP